MFEALAETKRAQFGDRGQLDSRLSGVAEATDELRRHFRRNCPILLDGALTPGDDNGHFVRQARESLSRGRVDPDRLPAAILRETLDSIRAVPRPATMAGLTAVGPRRARVWWDDRLLDNLDDVIANLNNPKPVLRFYDVTGLDPDSGRWNETFDLDVELAEKGRTVEFWASARRYVVDLGYIYADGRFLRLARTSCADLPREDRGERTDPEVARSALRPAERVAAIQPDALAREWVEARADYPTRDVNAELIVHALYRAFLEEGPRALRRAPKIVPRGGEALRREHAERSKGARRRPLRRKPALPAVLVTRLDPRIAPAVASLRYLPAPAAVFGLGSLVLPLTAGRERFVFNLGVNEFVRRGATVPAAVSDIVNDGDAVQTVRAEREDLIQALPEDADVATLLASPVFEAAQSLRRRLAGMEAAAEKPESVSESEDVRGGRKSARIRDFGGLESRRFAKAGVRLDRIALTLEGRMRPGARLKVAGKLVYADADGRFRLECVLSGRSASIPLRAGTSISGEARSEINVEWIKRGVGEKQR